MNKIFKEEIIQPRFPNLDPALQNIADRIERALEELETFPGEQGYAYENGVIDFDLSTLTDEERELYKKKYARLT